MSPVSRGRKAKKNKPSDRQRALPTLFGVQDECDCPSCSGEDLDPRQLVDEIAASAINLVAFEDPLDAEIIGATFVSMIGTVGGAFEKLLIDGFIPEFEALASREALALLLAIGSVTGDGAERAAAAAVDRLVEAGVPRPGWAAELGQLVTVTECSHLVDAQGTASVLACSFHRAGRSHAVVMSVDHLDCGAASEILLLDADHLSETLRTLLPDSRDSGFAVTQEELDTAEFRWRFENALDARAVHDGEQPGLGTDDQPIDDDGLPDYRTLAVLLRARMHALQASSRPKAPHGDHGTEFAAPEKFGQLIGNWAGASGALAPAASRDRATVAMLPPKRKKSDGVAPVYQIKVELRRAKPPIWRRLEVPADISLARLHGVIQAAFDWHDSHLHVFETPHGEFGAADAELGHRADGPVTLEQVAPTVRSKIRYTYDFGDDWQHDILVEKVLSRDETARYPRCTGGRRAAPPEDCGGIWGYAYLAEALADPNHPEHAEKLEWLGLDEATQFDPAAFDANAVAQALSRRR